MATHSSALPWKIPWTEEPGGLPTERLNFHFSLSCVGEGNGNPLQCSCLERPRDGRAWWAAVYGVTQSQTRLKRLSSSSSIPKFGSRGKRIGERGRKKRIETRETVTNPSTKCHVWRARPWGPYGLVWSLDYLKSNWKLTQFFNRSLCKYVCNDYMLGMKISLVAVWKM